MPEQTRKLDRFTATILAEATAETERTLEELAKKRTAARSEAEDRILLDAYNYIHGEVTRIKADAGRRVSRHMLENKRTLYLRRNEIAQEVFVLVRAQIESFTGMPAYVQRLQALFQDALRSLAGASQVRVYLRAKDMDQANHLRQSASQAVEIVEGAFLLGGLIAESSELGLRIDSTFDGALEELDGHFAELFGLSLSDEMDG